MGRFCTTFAFFIGTRQRHPAHPISPCGIGLLHRHFIKFVSTGLFDHHRSSYHLYHCSFIQFFLFSHTLFLFIHSNKTMTMDRLNASSATQACQVRTRLALPQEQVGSSFDMSLLALHQRTFLTTTMEPTGQLPTTNRRMSRQKLANILQQAMDIIQDDVDDPLFGSSSHASSDEESLPTVSFTARRNAPSN